MRKQISLLLLLILPFIAVSQSKLIYNEYFDYNYGYCPGDPQYDNWVGLITSLDTNSDKYLKITMKGTYDMAGKSCTDKYAVRQIADALYNGYDASISCDGNVWTVGTGCSDYNCGNYSDYIELTLNQYTCNCGTSYTIRPGITSPNWGGVNTETCQWYYQNANQNMILEVERVYGTDNMALRSMVVPNECAYNQPLYANVMNIGTNSVSNYYVGYSINGVAQTPIYVSNALNSDESGVVTLNSNYAFTANTAYTFKIWTYLPNGNADSETENDTIEVNYLHSGSPAAPTASNFVNCGVGKVDITASSSDSIAWYSQATGGTMIKIGSQYTTPFLYRTDTFYVEALRFKSTLTKYGSGFYNYTYISGDQYEYNGAMINLKASKLLKISGINVQAVFGNSTPHYKVYVRKGGFQGFETDSSTWTRIFDAELTNGGSINTIPFSFVMEPGVNYGFYITADPLNGEDVWINYGTNTYSNGDITLTGGNCVYGKFGQWGVYTPYTLDCEVLYETTCPSPSRTPIVVTINPKPYGSEIVASSNFQGKASLGLINDPDISEINKQLVYEFQAPSGYSNSGFGSTWDINSVYLETEYGTPVNTSLYSFTNPSGSSNGILTFTPDVNLLDSNIRIKVSTSDLGPYFCDSLITRIVHIAPTPKVNFSVPTSICAGDDVYFTNLSSIHSGGMSYKWYFTPNDSSDFVEPVQMFSTPGTYNVKLIAISDPYGVENDTTIVVQVGEIPKAAFKVNNACEGNPVTFTNQTQGTGVVFSWNFGDNTPTSNATNPSHTYSSPQRYSVSMTANLNGCIAKITKNAYLFPKPVAVFIAPSQSVCMNENITFINQSSILSGNIGAWWDFKDGRLSTIHNPVHSFSSPGTYQVGLKMISEFGCNDSTTRTVVIKPAPVVDFTTDLLCKNETTKFTNTSTEFSGINSTYTWEFSDGSTMNGKNVSRQWAIHGPKTVKLKSQLSNGCSSELEREILVKKQPKASFNTFDVCEDEAAAFVNGSTIEDGDLNFSWYFGDNSATGTDLHPTHKYTIATTTTFTVNLIVSVDAGCDDTAARQITITKTPVCDFTVAPFNQIGFNTYKFTPSNSSYDSYEWFFGEGGSSSLVSPTYQYSYLGNFNITLKAKDADCECEMTKNVAITQTGIDDLNSTTFNMYPNPADDVVYITLESSENAQVRIFDQLGQLVLTTDILGKSGDINVSELASGIYNIEVVIDGVSTFRKLSVVR